MRVFERGQPSSRMGIFRHAVRVWFATGTLIALSACGGGGGGGSSPPPSNPPANPPTNTAPTVDAGADQTIQLPTNEVEVTGTAEDPQGTAVTYAWTSDPADGVTFSSADAATTTVTFAAAGSYTLTLTASDGSLSGTDSLVVTVQEEGPPSGTAPVVSAGDDQTVEFPMPATLSGSATDDSTTVTYSWTAEPADGVTFADAAAASTTAKFPAPGTYELTLTASDGTESGSDSLSVTVGDPLYPAVDSTDDDPQRGWTFAAAADVGMDDALLEQARVYAETGGGSGVIVRYGRVVKAWGAIDTRLAVQSTTKSIGGIALGLAMDDGAIALTDLAVDKMQGFGIPPDTNADTGWLNQITVQQLATHTAGFEKNGGYSDLIDEPGTVWRYSDGGLNWLADVLTTVFARDLEELLVERVWNVLGVIEGDDVEWRTNASHDPTNAGGIAQRELASGMTINSQTMARVGLLFLRNGSWAGTPVVSKTFVDLVRTPTAEIADLPIMEDIPGDFPGATTSYGMLWWTNATGALPNVPTDAYWAWGQGDSLIVVIPSLDIVAARVGDILPAVPAVRAWGESDWNGDYAVLAPFLDPIVQSVQE